MTTIVHRLAGAWVAAHRLLLVLLTLAVTAGVVTTVVLLGSGETTSRPVAPATPSVESDCPEPMMLMARKPIC